MIDKLKKPTCIFIMLIFVAFAGVQYNDPDALYWVAIYLIPSLLAFLTLIRGVNRYILLLFVILYIGGGIYLWPDSYEGVSMPMSEYKPQIELARESLGLGIAAVALLWLWVISVFNPKPATVF